MKNPFDIFNLPINFELNKQLLSERYLKLQKQLHPDNFVTAEPFKQRLAIEQSADINEAFATLNNPVSRAEAIITLHTGQIPSIEEKSITDVTFLMQQLEWREKLEEIETTNDEAALSDFAKQVKAQTHLILTALSTHLKSEQWQQAALLCDKLRFMQKLTAEIERIEEKLFEI